MVDPTFRNINRLFILSFRIGRNFPTRNSFGRFDVASIEIKDSNVLIDKKPFSEQLIKNKQEMYENYIDYITGNLLTCIIKNTINSLA